MAKNSADKSREGGGIPRPQGTNGSPSKLAVRTNPSKVNIKLSNTTITAKHQPVTRTVSSEINKNTSNHPVQHSSDAYMAKLDQARVAYGRGGQRTLVNDKLYPRVPPPGPQLFHPGPQRSQTLSMIPSHSRSKMAAAAKTPGMASIARVSSPPMAGEPVSRMPVPSQYTGGIQQPPANQNTGLPLKGIMKTRLSSDLPSSSSAPTQSHSVAQIAQYQVPHGGLVGNPTHQIGHPSQQTQHSSSQQNVHSSNTGNHHLLQGSHPPHQNSHPLNHGVLQLQGSHQSSHLSQQGVHPSHQGSHPQQTIGHHSQQTVHTSQQTGHPSQQAGHLSQQSGHQIQQTGHPNQQGGHPNQQGGHPTQQGNHSQQGSHPNQSHPTSQSGPSHSTSHLQPLSLPNQSLASHPNMNQGPPQQQQQRPPPQNQGPPQQHQGPPQQGPLYQGSSLQHQAPVHQHQNSLSQHMGPPPTSHPSHQFHPMNSQHSGFKGTEQGQARGPLHNGTSFAGPKGPSHKHMPSSSYPVNSHPVQFGSLPSHPPNQTAHSTHTNPSNHPAPSNNHPSHLSHQPTNPLSVHPNHPPHPTPPPYQQPPPPTLSNNEINAALKEPTDTLSNVGPSQNELLKRLHSAKSEKSDNLDYSKKVKDSLNDLQNVKDLNDRLTEDNQELRDLCCFLDDDRQKGRKLAREWQRFGRYTASVMRQEVSNYQSKLKMLEAKQQELIKDNLELKELCLYLDEERSGGGVCKDCGGACSVVPLPVPGLQAIRDEGDGSSSSTNNDESEVSLGRLVDGLSSPDAMFFSELKMQKLGLSDEVLSYIRNLEERISASEGGREFVSNRIIHDNSMEDLKDNNRPEAVTNAMKVLEVHEHVLEKSLDSDDTQDELGDGEKALVREMCNVVWRKLEEG